MRFAINPDLLEKVDVLSIPIVFVVSFCTITTTLILVIGLYYFFIGSKVAILQIEEHPVKVPDKQLANHCEWRLPDTVKSLNNCSLYENLKLHGILADVTMEEKIAITNILDTLSHYKVDPVRGFLSSDDPLQRLPSKKYDLWENIAADLPKLLGARLGQARGPLSTLPVISIDELKSDTELRRAHLILALFAHSFVFGGASPKDYIPEGIAIPFWQVSKKLGIPPVLGHTSIVLYNWRRLDPRLDICMENLSTLNNFFDGRDESWFYLITVEVESRGARAILPLLLCMDAIKRFESQITCDEVPVKVEEEETGGKFEVIEKLDPKRVLIGQFCGAKLSKYIIYQLKEVAMALTGMCDSLENMREGCHPFIFYHRVRPFLSGWRNNPTLPEGLLYKGGKFIRVQFTF